eukprot:3833893-Prymnesium_polylepis.1
MRAKPGRAGNATMCRFAFALLADRLRLRFTSVSDRRKAKRTYLIRRSTSRRPHGTASQH